VLLGTQHATTAPRNAAALRNVAPSEAAPLRLDNPGVVRLVHSGLASKVIVAAIRAAPVVDFDLAPAALEALQRQRVPDVVSAAMLDRARSEAIRAAAAAVREERRAGRQAANATAIPETMNPTRLGHLAAQAMAELEVVGGDGRIMVRLPALALNPNGEFVTSHPEAFEGRAVRLRVANGSIYDSVMLVDRDLRRSIAVVRIKTEGLVTPLPGETGTLTPGHRLWVWDAGARQLQPVRFQTWTMAGQPGNSEVGYRLLALSGTSVPEGAPLLNDAGDVLGVVQVPPLGVQLQPVTAGLGAQSPGTATLFAIPIEDIAPFLHSRAGRQLPAAPALALTPVPAPWAGWLDALRRAKTIFVWDRTRAGWGGRAEAEVLRHGPWRIVPDPDEADLWLQLSEFRRGTLRGESLQVYERSHRRLLWSADALSLPWRRSTARRLVDQLLASVPPVAVAPAAPEDLVPAGRLRAPFPRSGLTQKP